MMDRFFGRTLDELQKKVDSLQASLEHAEATARNAVEKAANLEQRLQALSQTIQSGRRVDMVDFGELRVFMYTDDLGYRQIDERYKHKTTGRDDRDLSQPRRLPAERYANPAEPLISLLLSHHWIHGLDFSVIDVGCQYGTSAMAIAQVVLASDRNNHVFAFDPGLAGELAAFNISLNRLDGRVTYERMAVSDNDIPSIVFCESGHSENNRIVNRSAGVEGRSYVTRCTSLDGYVNKHNLSGSIIAKIDTQGGEIEVFRGMTELRCSRHVTCITEFSPHPISTREDPEQWLRAVSANCAVFEIHGIDAFLDATHQLRPIQHAEMGAFVKELMERPDPYTDMLILPETLPGFQDLVSRLTSIEGPQPSASSQPEFAPVPE